MTDGAPNRAKLVKDLTDELEALAVRVLTRAYEQVSKKPEIDIPILESLAQDHFPDAWGRSKIEALELVLRHAVRQLDGLFGTISRQHAALLLFNLDGTPEGFPEILPLADIEMKEDYAVGSSTQKKQYGFIRARLLDAARPQGKEVRVRGELNRMRADIAEVLIPPVSDQPEAPSVPLRPVVKNTVDDTFIYRPSYETTIRQLRTAGERHVWLHGDAGTGKTRLARAANRDVLDECDVPVLLASDEAQLEQQVAELISRSGVKAETLNSANLWPLFFASLSAGKLPAIIVFDDMKPGRRLDQLWQIESQSFIVFTSASVPPCYPGSGVEVHDMNGDEARSMISSRLPSATEEDAARIIGVLGGRPLALEHSCAFLRETGMAVETYCHAVGEAPADTLHAAGEQYGKSLTATYRLMISELEKTIGSLRAMDYLVFTLGTSTPIDRLSELWPESLSVEPGDSASGIERAPDVASMAMAARWSGVVHVKSTSFLFIKPAVMVQLHGALRRLTAFRLIRADRDLLVLNKLTRSILRDLRRESELSVHEKIRSVAMELIKIDNWEPDEIVPSARAYWGLELVPLLMAQAASVLNRVEDFTDSEIIDAAMQLTLAVGSLRQRGVYLKEFVGGVLPLAGVIAAYYFYGELDDERKLAAKEAFLDTFNQLAGFRIDQSFDTAEDGKLFFNGEYDGELKSWSIRARLRHDTEWQSYQELSVPDSWESQMIEVNKPRVFVESASSEVMNGSVCDSYKSRAVVALELATKYYDEARWDDAIGTLEHSYSCFIKVGADATATHHGMDAARRLAKVHLRAGNLNDATFWLMRAQWLHVERSAEMVNGNPSRYRFRDRLLEIRLRQIADQVEFTRTILALEVDAPERFNGEIRHFLIEPYESGKLDFPSTRMREARDAVSVTLQIGQFRLFPELVMHLLRFKALLGDPTYLKDAEMLAEWLNGRSKYGSELARFQLQSIGLMGVVALLESGDSSIQANFSEFSDLHQSHLAEVARAPLDYLNECLRMTRRMRDVHDNIYWYARGLCGCYLLAEAANVNEVKLEVLRNEMRGATARIGRNDWCDSVLGLTDYGLIALLVGY